MRSLIYKALESYLRGNIDKHVANVKLHAEAAVGVAEHSDHIETIDKELGKIAEFEDRLEVLRKHFKETKEVLYQKVNGYMKKKKILLLSDDLRMHSGIATVSKDIVMETLNEYDWVQLAGAIKHPDKGKVFDMSSGLDEYNIKDGYLKVYPVDGYGDEGILREVMELEKPDAILPTIPSELTIWLLEFPIADDIPIDAPNAPKIAVG